LLRGPAYNSGRQPVGFVGLRPGALLGQQSCAPCPGESYSDGIIRLAGWRRRTNAVDAGFVSCFWPSGDRSGGPTRPASGRHVPRDPGGCLCAAQRGFKRFQAAPSCESSGPARQGRELQRCDHPRVAETGLRDTGVYCPLGDHHAGYADGEPTRLDRYGSAPHLAPWELKARKRERVRCLSLVDWPVYPRLRRNYEGLVALS
jgi:hypothetical protein